MDGQLTRDEIEMSMNMAAEGCKVVHQLQADALKRVYERSDEVKSVPLGLVPGQLRPQ